MKFERKIKIIPTENIEKITQVSGSGITIIGHQGIRASKMAFEGLKLRYPNTTAFALGKHVNFLIVYWFISSFFAIYYDVLPPARVQKNAIQS